MDKFDSQRLFHTIDIKQKLSSELKSTTQDLKIISAYCKLGALQFIDSHLEGKKIKKKLLVRFDLQDIIAGATDFAIIVYCLKNDWKLFFDLKLHSKLYVFDNSSLILGSANLTSRGFGLDCNSNIESVVFMNDLTPSELHGIDMLFLQSKEITDEVIEIMEEQLRKVEFPQQAKQYSWNSDIAKLFEQQVFYLWTTEMFFSNSPNSMEEHDRILLGLTTNYSKKNIRDSFLNSKAFLWLVNCFRNEEMYFGELTVELHNSLLDDPKPYRKDVKILLANLLNWARELDIPNVKIDRPNHSQRVRIS